MSRAHVSVAAVRRSAGSRSLRPASRRGPLRRRTAKSHRRGRRRGTPTTPATPPESRASSTPRVRSRRTASRRAACGRRRSGEALLAGHELEAVGVAGGVEGHDPGEEQRRPGCRRRPAAGRATGRVGVGRRVMPLDPVADRQAAALPGGPGAVDQVGSDGDDARDGQRGDDRLADADDDVDADHRRRRRSRSGTSAVPPTREEAREGRRRRAPTPARRRLRPATTSAGALGQHGLDAGVKTSQPTHDADQAHQGDVGAERGDARRRP